VWEIDLSARYVVKVVGEQVDTHMRDHLYNLSLAKTGIANTRKVHIINATTRVCDGSGKPQGSASLHVF
jgi:hypothetical protein